MSKEDEREFLNTVSSYHYKMAERQLRLRSADNAACTLNNPVYTEN